MDNELEKFSQSLLNDPSSAPALSSSSASSFSSTPPAISSENVFASASGAGAAGSLGGFISFFAPVIISVAVISIAVIALPKIFNINPPAPAVSPPPPPPNYQTDSQFCGTSANDAVNCNAYGTGYSCVAGVCRCNGGGCACTTQPVGSCSGVNQRCTASGCACNNQGLTYCSNTGNCHDLLAGQLVQGLSWPDPNNADPNDPNGNLGSTYSQIQKCGTCFNNSVLLNPSAGSNFDNYGCCNGGLVNFKNHDSCNSCTNDCTQNNQNCMYQITSSEWQCF